MKNKTTAQYLLDLIFEGHEIRYSQDENGTFFVAKDVCESIGIKRHRDSLKGLEKFYREYATNGGKQSFRVLTQMQVMKITLQSRNPAARRLQIWLVDEVIPEVIRYGCYLRGATKEEKIKHLYHLWKRERSEYLNSEKGGSN